MLSDLTTLYDCPDTWTKETATQGCPVIPGAYVCMLAASTAQGLSDTIPSGTVGQGFTSRLIFACSDYALKRVEEKPWGKKQQKLFAALQSDFVLISKCRGAIQLRSAEK